MPFTDSARGQFSQIVPTDPTAPTVPAHLQNIVDQIEGQTVLRVADEAERDGGLTPLENGMIVYVSSINALFLRVNGVWQKMHPTHLTGTGTPSDVVGDDGDLYFQTA